MDQRPLLEGDPEPGEQSSNQRNDLEKLHEQLEQDALEFQQIQDGFLAYQQKLLRMELQAAEALDRAVRTLEAGSSSGASETSIYGKFINIMENAFGDVNDNVVDSEMQQNDDLPSCCEAEAGTPPYLPSLPLLNMGDLEDDESDFVFISPSDNPLFYETDEQREESALPPIHTSPRRRSRSC